MTREEKAKLIEDVATWVKNNYPLDEEIYRQLVAVGQRIVADGIQTKAAYVQTFAMNDHKPVDNPLYQQGRQLILTQGYAATCQTEAVKHYVRANNL